MSDQPQTENDQVRLRDLILHAHWPDGGTDGFPSVKVASMIADHLIASGVSLPPGTGSVS